MEFLLNRCDPLLVDVPYFDILLKKKNAGEKRLRINVIGQKAIVSPKQGQADAGFIVYSRKRKVSILSN